MFSIGISYFLYKQETKGTISFYLTQVGLYLFFFFILNRGMLSQELSEIVQHIIFFSLLFFFDCSDLPTLFSENNLINFSRNVCLH